ncbi:MAG: carbohydrate-binding protein [Flavobacteriaceae bacterium]|nr:carbohydrate-binding protein [Flavobacteriaceae bacterium]
MKKINFKTQVAFAFVGFLALALVSCERGFSDEITLATYPETPEVFTDFPVGLTDAFFVSFDPAGGANVNGFGTDENEAYKGNSSIRIDVPDSGDPEGNYIGGIFLDRGNGRDLTNYDALTFWAKGAITAEVGLFGFGTDFQGDKYAVGLNNIALSTDWKQYTIPIPDPTKLVQEKGMFIFAAGTASTNGLGYTFWIDEIKFEKLGTIGQVRNSIFSGEDVSMSSFNDAIIQITGISQTRNLGDGTDVTVDIAAGYLDYESSDLTVAKVNELGQITIVGAGNAVITASAYGIETAGSLTLTSLGDFTLPTAPTHAAADVISIFSDVYTNVNIDFYNGYWEPWQTTTSNDFDINGDNILSYDSFNFVGHQFSDPTVDASDMTHFHMDVYIPGTLAAGAKLKVTIKDFGANNEDGGGDDTTQTFTISGADLSGDAWSSIDVALSLSSKTRVGQFVFENDGSDLTKLYMDNVYFYKQ